MYLLLGNIHLHYYRSVLLHYVKFTYIIIIIFITIICTFNLHFVIRLKHICGRHGLLQLAQTTVDLVAELGAGVLLGTRPPPASRGGGGHALVQTVDSRPEQMENLIFTLFKKYKKTSFGLFHAVERNLT